MLTEPSRFGTQPSSRDNLLSQASNLLKSLRWVSPLVTLRSKGGSDFGRNIETVLTELPGAQGIMRIQLHRKDAAVVMTVGHYEKMVEMKVLYESLIEQVKDKKLAESSSEFDKLYSQLTSVESLKAADSLFTATADDLRGTYKPGRTEKQ